MYFTPTEWNERTSYGGRHVMSNCDLAPASSVASKQILLHNAHHKRVTRVINPEHSNRSKRFDNSCFMVLYHRRLVQSLHASPKSRARRQKRQSLCRSQSDMQRHPIKTPFQSPSTATTTLTPQSAHSPAAPRPPPHSSKPPAAALPAAQPAAQATPQSS